MNRPLDEMVHAYLDGQLSAAEVAEFQQRILAEPALADQLVAQAREEAIITEWARAHRSAEIEVVPSRSRGPRLAMAGLAALAATLLVAFAVKFFEPHIAADTSFAELEDVTGEVYIVGETGESTAAKSGNRLMTGQGLRTGEGGYAIVVSNATRLEVGADTSIRLTATAGQSHQVFLEQGSVAADVTRQTEKPMLLSTEQGEAYLESKSSFLSVPEGTRIEAEVGPVRFRKKNGQSVRVPQGWYAVALPANANPTVPRPLPVRQSKPRFTLEEESGPVLTVAISPDGTLLAAGCFDGSVKLYDTADGSLRRAMKLHRQQVRCLAFAPDGSMLASASNDRKVQLTDPRTGRDLGKLGEYKGVIESLAFSPRGDLLATGGSQGRELAEVRVWNLTTRQEVASLNHHALGVMAVAFSPDGAMLASAGRDQLVNLVDLATLTVRSLEGHRAPVSAIAFSPDGTALVSGGRDRTLRVWDVATGVQRTILAAQPNPVRSLAFAPNGEVLAAADVHIRLYDWATGQERLLLKGHKKQISAVAFSADGKLMVTSSLDKTIRLWDVPEEEPEPKPAG